MEKTETTARPIDPGTRPAGGHGPRLELLDVDRFRREVERAAARHAERGLGLPGGSVVRADSRGRAPGSGAPGRAGGRGD